MQLTPITNTVLRKKGYRSSSRNLYVTSARAMDAGADSQHLSGEGRRAILGYPPEPDPDLLEVSEGEFALYRERRFGERNPAVMNNAFWVDMIRSGINAYEAGKMFGVERKFDGNYTPIRCAQRFGQTMTFLSDGRIVQVAGEHEDYYDPDFCIYNDVFVHSPDGSITIYGYPESIFPPTDFHTATVVGKYIYLVGSLGYTKDRRHGQTPVYRLDTETFEIEPLQTKGERLGWIHKHRAVASATGEIRVYGGEIVSVKDGKEVLRTMQRCSFSMLSAEFGISSKEWQAQTESYVRSIFSRATASKRYFIILVTPR